MNNKMGSVKQMQQVEKREKNMERNIKVLVKNKFEKYIKTELRLISKRKEAAKESNFISTAAKTQAPITKKQQQKNQPLQTTP